MTPLPRKPGRTATISLSTAEEALIRLGQVDLPIAEGILTKLRKSLEVSDILFRPAPIRQERPPKARGATVSLEDLGL